LLNYKTDESQKIIAINYNLWHWYSCCNR
jgi:hypothetical protein